MPDFYYRNDSSFQSNYGTVYLTISGASTGVYLAESLTLTTPTSTVEIRDHLNRPAGSIVQENFTEGTATLQVSGAFPTIGARFGYDGRTFFITDAGHQLSQTDIYKAPISFRREYNA
jgi:hypothetical protein